MAELTPEEREALRQDCEMLVSQPADVVSDLLDALDAAEQRVKDLEAELLLAREGDGELIPKVIQEAVQRAERAEAGEESFRAMFTQAAVDRDKAEQRIEQLLKGKD